MTRKCAICKETNYKNGSSFFSAPKDPETRRLWQAVIGIQNHVVKDETFVCSKHFYSTDIITHWVSGVPPNVITIKYKKFRLRPGAIPKITVDPDEIDPQFVECDDEFRVNRSSSPSNPLSLTHSKCYEIYSVPREHFTETLIETIQFEDMDSQESFEIVTECPPKEELMKFPTDYISEENDKSTEIEESEEVERFIASEVIEHPLYEEKEVCLIKDTTPSLEVKNNNFSKKHSTSESMLFEDLLEMHKEVALPKGWNSFVISKGHGTTIVFCLMTINKSGLPLADKQVFVKNNMQLRCTAKNISINPVVHNLVEDSSSLTVKTLTDVEEFIEKFSKQHICTGNVSKYLINEISKEAYKDASNIWRHNSCPLLIDNEVTRCSKCASLSKRKPRFEHNLSLIRKSRLEGGEKRLKALNESIEEQRNSTVEDRLSALSVRSQNLISEIVDLTELPEIQKVMIKECFKLKNNEETNDVEFSRTWIFLCLLLYIESPEMYKYMLLNKYMNLPPLFTVRAYLRRVKSDREFYKIFQQSVEGFQPFKDELNAKQLE